MKWVCVILGLLIMNTALFAGYKWPLKPFNQQHNISGTFCENRPSGNIERDHFHNAIDIPLTQGGQVFAIESGTVSVIVETGYTAQIRVGRFNYLHVNPLTSLQVGDYVEESELVGHTNYANHIHLIDGHYPNYVNPLRKDGIAPFEDPYLPTVSWIRFYKDGTTQAFQNNRVEGLVEVAARLYDRTDNGSLGSNNGIYKAGYQIYDSTGTVALSDPVVPYQFDVRPSNAYIKNVYFRGSDLSTYIYTLTNKVNRNGYWDTRDYEAGTYKIKVFTEDTRDNCRTAWKTVEVVEQDNTAPAKPQITRFLGLPDGGWQLKWLPNDSSDISGYDFWFSLDGEYYNHHDEISQAIAAGDTAYLYESFGFDYPLYVKLYAYDNAAIPNTSTASNVYGVKLSESGADALIVDGFYGSDRYWGKPNHSYVKTYGEMLLENGWSFNSCTYHAIQSGQVRLEDYKAVFYFKGNAAGLSKNEKAAVSAYLESGGQLFIGGANILAGLMAQDDSVFAAKYLRTGLAADSSNNVNIQDENALAFATIKTETDIVPACDMLKVLPGSDPILFYGNGRVAGVYYKGAFGDSDKEGKVITLSLPFELATPNSARQTLFDQMLKPFRNETALGHRQNMSGSSLEPLQNYPNPFNNSTTITFKVEEPGWVKVQIFDLGGRMLETIVNRKLKRGQYRVNWQEEANSTGVYICRLRTAAKTETIKLILIK